PRRFVAIRWLRSKRSSPHFADRGTAGAYHVCIVNRRRLLVGVVVVLIALVVVASVGVIALPGIVRWGVARQLSAATGRPVTLERTEVSLLPGRLGLRGLRVIDRDGTPLATLDRVDVRFSPRELLRGHGHVTDVAAESLMVRVIRTGPDTFNISDLLA